MGRESEAGSKFTEIQIVEKGDKHKQRNLLSTGQKVLYLTKEVLNPFFLFIKVQTGKIKLPGEQS